MELIVVASIRSKPISCCDRLTCGRGGDLTVTTRQPSVSVGAGVLLLRHANNLAYAFLAHKPG